MPPAAPAADRPRPTANAGTTTTKESTSKTSSQELMDPTRVLPCEKWLYALSNES
jgi:hypothetical protein